MVTPCHTGRMELGLDRVSELKNEKPVRRYQYGWRKGIKLNSASVLLCLFHFSYMEVKYI